MIVIIINWIYEFVGLCVFISYICEYNKLENDYGLECKKISCS